MPRLFVLCIGVDRYDHLDSNSQLRFPDDDARAVAELFKAMEGSLFREVRVKVLAGDDNPPTGDNVLDSLDFFRASSQYDTCVLFVAGHGVRDSRGTYYFVPRDGEMVERNGLLEPRRSSMVMWATFKDALDVPGRKLFLLDTCHSESASGIKRRAMDSMQMVKELRDESTVILTAARGDESALEREDWGHGAFTKTLLDGLREKQADLIKDGKISIKELDTFISENVPKLTNGAQHPITFAPSGFGSYIVYQ